MAGFSNISGDESIMFADNASFDGTERGGKMISDGQLWIGATAGRHVRLGSITAGTGISVTNGPGTITIASTATTTDLYNAKWIVNGTANAGGNQLTITAALNVAVSGDTIFIRTGTYTENLTLKAGVDLVAYGTNGDTPTVTIIGKHTATFTGTASFCGVRLQTNSDNFLVVSGSNATIVNLRQCYLNCPNNTGISFTSSNAAATINMLECRGNLGTTGIGLFASTSTGSLTFFNCNISNSGSSVTASTMASSGSLVADNSIFGFAMTTSSTAGTRFQDCLWATFGINTTAVNINGTGSNSLNNCRLNTGTAVPLTIGTGVTVSINNCALETSNANTITGLGTAAVTSITNNLNPITSVIGTTGKTGYYNDLGAFRSFGQPCLSAYKSANTTNVTGDNTAYTVIFDTVIFDQGSNYNNSSGVFTFPVTGRYLVTGSIDLTAIGAQTFGSVNIVTTARSWGYNNGNPANMKDAFTSLSYPFSAIVDASASNTMSITVTIGTTTKTVSVAGGAAPITFLSVSLLC